MKRIIVPGAVVVIVVMSLVGLSGWNRTAEPRLTIQLTERELALPYDLERSSREGAPISVRLQFEGRHDALDARNWLSEDRLRALGFNLATPAGAPEAADRYRRVTPRIAWVAFEYDGPAYQAIARRRALEQEKNHPVWRGRMEPSRLVPVDAGPDFDALLGRYPTGHLIARAVIGLHYLGPSDRGPLVYGIVRELVPARITVTRQWREILLNLPPQPASGPDGPHTEAPPRYVAEIASGPLGVLYLRSVRAR
jgi:hypothetical protein